MKINPTAPKQMHALLMAFISALVIHGLVLSYLRLPRNQRTVPVGLQSRDNTPELLQFSSQATQESHVDLLPLPKASILPPPRVQVPARASRPKPKHPGRMTTKSVIPMGKKSPQPTQSLKPSPISPPDVPKDFVKAVETLRLFIGTSPSSSSLPTNRSTNRVTLLPTQETAYDELWSAARSHPIGSLAKRTLPHPDVPVEIRSFSLDQAQKIDLPIQHQQFLVMKDRIVLFWIDGQWLWIYQSSNTPVSAPDSGQ